MGAPFSTTLSDYTKAFSLTWGASWEKLVWLILEQSPLLYLMYKKGAIHLEADSVRTRREPERPDLPGLSGPEHG